MSLLSQIASPRQQSRSQLMISSIRTGTKIATRTNYRRHHLPKVAERHLDRLQLQFRIPRILRIPNLPLRRRPPCRKLLRPPKLSPRNRDPKTQLVRKHPRRSHRHTKVAHLHNYGMRVTFLFCMNLLSSFICISCMLHLCVVLSTQNPSPKLSWNPFMYTRSCIYILLCQFFVCSFRPWFCFVLHSSLICIVCTVPSCTLCQFFVCSVRLGFVSFSLRSSQLPDLYSVYSTFMHSPAPKIFDPPPSALKEKPRPAVPHLWNDVCLKECVHADVKINKLSILNFVSQSSIVARIFPNVSLCFICLPFIQRTIFARIGFLFLVVVCSR